MVNPEDDARIAYALVTACPTITPDIASYQSASNFKMTLDSLEISRFMIALNIAILERSKVRSKEDRLSVSDKIAELKRALVDLDKGLTPEQVKLIVGQIQVNQIDAEVVSAGEELKSAATIDADDYEDDYQEEPLTPQQEALARRLLRQHSES